MYRKTPEKFWTLTKIKSRDIICTKILPTGKCTNTAARIVYGRNKKDYYCPDCTGFILSRYASVIVPEPTDQELEEKKKYDYEIYRRANRIMPLELSTE